MAKTLTRDEIMAKVHAVLERKRKRQKEAK